MREVKFYRCTHCGNMVGLIHNGGVPLMCCGQKMVEVVANTTDAAKEKHVPVVAIDGTTVTVTVGSTLHPMLEAHYIEWIYILTEQGGQRKLLAPGAKPEAVFALAGGDKLVAAYAYCNLHGLWMTRVEG